MKKILLRTIAHYVRSIFLIFPFDYLLANFTKGKKEGTFFTRLRPYPERYKSGNYKSITRNGIKYRVDISEFLSWRLFYNTKNKSEQQLYKLVEKEMYVFDIGSNIGEISMNLAEKVGENGKVFSFEPDLDNFQHFKSNLELNSFSNINSFKMGLSVNAGFGTIHVPDTSNFGKNYLTIEDENDNNTVPLSSIDIFSKEHSINKLDLIKIDTEGHEMKILMGGIETLKKYKPTLFVELNDRFLERSGNTALELIEFLENLGYQIHEAVNKTIINSASNLIDIHFDIIAIHSTDDRNL